VVEIANPAAIGRRPAQHAGGERSAVPGDAFAPLTTVTAESWRQLAERAIEPNGYYLPGWELAVNATAPGRTGAFALSAWSEVSPAPGSAARLIGLLPAISLWRACRIPLPALVSADPYGTLGTPLLDRDMACEAAMKLVRQARLSGAHALILRDAALDGATVHAFTEVLRQDGLKPKRLRSLVRASLDATGDAERVLRDGLGPKKMKELRRQRNRLAGHGAVVFQVARTPQQVAAAVEQFLALEASGWKGKAGTALLQHAGDASFVRRATMALAASGQCEIVSLHAGNTPVAAAIVLRHQDRAFYFKLGVDERFAKFSPGVQLTLDLTRHLCADPAIASADSTATPDHPMINPIWRGRFAIGDVLIPLRRNDPAIWLIHAAMRLRSLVRAPARWAVRLIRNRRGKPPAAIPPT
jgi:CelD/BcsL family acetyltransferase involved in cellulose biosynthesis